MAAGGEASPTADAFANWDDALCTPRVSHRVALAVIVGASLGCYTILYVIGSLASRLLIGV